MGVHVIFAADVFADQVVLAIVAEDHVDLLGAGTADVRAEHDLVRRLAVHVGLVQGAVEQLHIAAAAVDVLLVLHGELHHEGLALVGEAIEFAAGRVESGILRGLNAWMGGEQPWMMMSPSDWWLGWGWGGKVCILLL